MKKRMRKSSVKVAFAMQQWETFHSISKASKIPDGAFLASLGWICKSRLPVRDAKSGTMGKSKDTVTRRRAWDLMTPGTTSQPLS